MRNPFFITKSLLGIAYWLLLTTFCHSQIPEETTSGIEIRKTIQQAEDLFEAALFAESIPLYREVLSSIEKKAIPAKNSPAVLRPAMSKYPKPRALPWAVAPPVLRTEQKFCRYQPERLSVQQPRAAPWDYSSMFCSLKDCRKFVEKGSMSHEKGLLDKIDAEIRFRLAQALFHVKDYKSAVALLQDPRTPIDHRFLLGSALRNNQDYDKAIEILSFYLEEDQQKIVTHREEAFFELALAFYYKGDLDHAKIDFETVLKSSSNSRLLILSNFYLARIKMMQNDWDDAEAYLNQADPIIKENDLLKYESAFLRGEIHYKKQQYENAIIHFEEALPAQNPELAKWYEESLFYLGMSNLKLADNSFYSKEQQKTFFALSKQNLEKLLELQSLDSAAKERVWLAQGEYYLTLGKRFNDEKALKQAEEIFADQQKFSSQEYQNQALLLKSQTPAAYTERDYRLRQLTHSSNAAKAFYAQAWYLRGLNDYEEGLSKNAEESQKNFERAANSLETARDLLIHKQPDLAVQVILLQARAYEAKQTEKDRQKALAALQFLWENQGQSLRFLKDPLEAHLLYSHIIAQMPQESLPMAIAKLQEGLTAFPQSPRYFQARYLLGTLFYKKADYEKAEETFQQLTETSQASSLDSSLVADALYRASQCAEKLHKERSLINAYRQRLLNQFPSSPIAPEASFNLFSYQEYLQGDRTAIKHLNAFPEIYPDSPLVLNALLLIGIDHKRDRRSSEGKSLRKKNLTNAIDHFQEVDTCFQTLQAHNKIPTDQREHYLLIRYRALLEKALAHFTLANESTGTKKQIYLEYSQEVYHQLLDELHKGSYQAWIVNTEPFWHLEEESAFGLSQALLSAKETEEAENALTKMLEKYDASKITRGYFLSRTWSTLGAIARERQDYARALECFLKAEDTAKGKVLSTDQRLDLLIQQSACLRELKQPEKAILILSKVVNDDAVSGLRIKALFLRAEIYENQGRRELARKQLDAAAKKGGEWSLKAKAKLEKEYGYR
jgi:tetratricopeptide (TPR) repeat protein